MAVRPLLDMIGAAETPGYDNPYLTAYGGAPMPPGMTVGEALAWAKAHGKRTGSSAVGRYQILAPTLEGLLKKTGIPLDTEFSPQVQDYLAKTLMEEKGLSDYLSGKMQPQAFAAGLAQTWAGLPKGPGGQSVYQGDKMGNKATVPWEFVRNTLESPDVRMAALDTPPGTPTGDPMTGRMDRGTLPPDLGLAYDPAELSRRLADSGGTREGEFLLDPFLHVGLGILGGSGQNAMQGIARGAQQGLATYQAALQNEQALKQKSLANFLYGTQLAQGWNSQAQRGQLTEYQRATLNLKNRPGDLQTYYDAATGTYHTGYTDPNSGQFVSGGASVDVSTMAPVRGVNPTAGKTSKPPALGTSGNPLPEGTSPSWALPLTELETLAKTIEANPGAERALGTAGALGSPVVAAAGIADAFLGTKAKDWTLKAFGGQDPVMIRSGLEKYIMDIARAMVDEKGPLAVTEQNQARRLLGVLQGEGLVDPATAKAALNETRRIFTLMTIRSARAEGQEIPPEWQQKEKEAETTKSFLDAMKSSLPPRLGSASGAMPPSSSGKEIKEFLPDGRAVLDDGSVVTIKNAGGR